MGSSSCDMVGMIKDQCRRYDVSIFVQVQNVFDTLVLRLMNLVDEYEVDFPNQELVVVGDDEHGVPLDLVVEEDVVV